MFANKVFNDCNNCIFNCYGCALYSKYTSKSHSLCDSVLRVTLALLSMFLLCNLQTHTNRETNNQTPEKRSVFFAFVSFNNECQSTIDIWELSIKVNRVKTSKVIPKTIEHHYFVYMQLHGFDAIIKVSVFYPFLFVFFLLIPTLWSAGEKINQTSNWYGKREKKLIKKTAPRNKNYNFFIVWMHFECNPSQCSTLFVCQVIVCFVCTRTRISSEKKEFPLHRI